MVIDLNILNVVEAFFNQFKVSDVVWFDVVINCFLYGDDWDALAVELEEVDGGGGWLWRIDVGGLGGADELGEAEVGA